jgi:hypothetical protein
MRREPTPSEHAKPLAGTCHHQWQNEDTPFAVAQLCTLCRLFRYKIAATADWEYRAPIPVGRPSMEQE